MKIMIPQMVAICNDYFWNTIPFFPLNSTHMRFSFGQNRVTERKETLLLVIQIVKQCASYETYFSTEISESLRERPEL